MKHTLACLAVLFAHHLTIAATPTTLKPLEKTWFSPRYYALSNQLPIGDSITINRTYGFDTPVIYRYELWVDGTLLRSSVGAPLRTALDEKLLGKKGTIIVKYKTSSMKSFALADSAVYLVAPRALFITVVNSAFKTGDALHLYVFQGINPQLRLPVGTRVHVADDQGGRFFDETITISHSPEVVVPMKQGATVGVPTAMTIRIATSIANQLEDEEAITVYPKSLAGAEASPTCATNGTLLETISTGGLALDSVETVVVHTIPASLAAEMLQTVSPVIIAQGIADRVMLDNKTITGATVVAVRVNGSSAVLRILFECQRDTSFTRVTQDRKTGETVARKETAHLMSEYDLKGANCEAAMSTRIMTGASMNSTVGEALLKEAGL